MTRSELRLRVHVQITENLRCDSSDLSAIDCRDIVVCSGGSKRDAVDENSVNDRSDDCIPVPIDNRGYRGVEMCIQVISPESSSPFA
jgi:hypothetical protein